MADLSHLGGLNPVETLELDNLYPTAKVSTFRLAPKGRYTLRAPDSFTSASFTRTKSGNLQAQIDPTIVGPTNEGATVRFVKVSAKAFEREGKYVSQIGDYLAACGFQGTLRDEQSIANAVEQTAGRVYEANLDWEASNYKTGFRVKGMENFPKNEDGTYQSWVIDPTTKDENGNPKRLLANLVIPFGGFIPAAQ